jgi:biotin carboxylase
MAPRVLLLASTTSYRTDDFAAAARRLDVEPVLGTDRCHVLAEIWDREAFGGSLQVELRDVIDAAKTVVAEARERPIAAIVPTDDATAEVAALAARELGLPGNSPEAARTARNKRLMREALAREGVPCPPHQVFGEDEDPAEVARRVSYPCVLKPLLCSASRGVIRADDPESIVAAWKRLHALLQTPALRAVADPDGHRILVEGFAAGPEVAVEGLVRNGQLTVLAFFDKPDPLVGPFFEETIYVTPSRHPVPLQRAAAMVTQRAARAIGLGEGPIHAELRLTLDGPVVLEVAARSIGGLCARTLRFGLGDASLEEIVLRHALGLELGPLDRRGAAGVMMIPIPKGGVFQSVAGVEDARAEPLVEDVAITAKEGQVLVPLPEGNAYLGFLFARGDNPDSVEQALRRAHAHLAFTITPTLPTA